MLFITYLRYLLSNILKHVFIYTTKSHPPRKDTKKRHKVKNHEIKIEAEIEFKRRKKRESNPIQVINNHPIYQCCPSLTRRERGKKVEPSRLLRRKKFSKEALLKKKRRNPDFVFLIFVSRRGEERRKFGWQDGNTRSTDWSIDSWVDCLV